MNRLLQHHFDHWVRSQVAIQIVQLFARGGADGAGEADVLGVAAAAHLDAGCVEIPCMHLHHDGDGLCEAGLGFAEHFDWEVARVFDEGVFAMYHLRITSRLNA